MIILAKTGQGGFQVDSPVKKPRASQMARCAPPYTDRAGEEPCQGGWAKRKALGRQSVAFMNLANPHEQVAQHSVHPVLIANLAISDRAAPRTDLNGYAQKNESAHAR